MFHGSPVGWLGIVALGFLAWMVFGGRHSRPRRWRWVPILGVCLLGWWVMHDHQRHDRAGFIERVRHKRTVRERHLQEHSRELADRRPNADIDEHIDRALGGQPSRLDARGPNTTLELKIHAAASAEAGADAARWGAALWTLLDAAGQDPGPGQVDLRRLERIVVVDGEDRDWTIAELGRLGRRTRRDAADGHARVALAVRLDQADDRLDAEEIALELETHEAETKASERALTEVKVDANRIDAQVEIARLPKLAVLPPLPADAPPAPPEPAVVDVEVHLEPPVPLVAPPAPVAAVPATPPAPSASLAEAIAAEVARNVGEGLSDAAEAIAEAHSDAAQARADEAAARAEAQQALAEAHREAADGVREALAAAGAELAADAEGGTATPTPTPGNSRLDVAPFQLVTERPAWLDQPPGTRDGTYYLVDSAGPFATREECELRLPLLFELMGERYARMLRLDVAPRFDQLLDQGVCREAYIGPRETSLGAMYEIHALAAFDQRALGYLREAQRAEVVRGRMVVAGTVAAMCLGLLATLFGYLRLDTSTRGFYSGRLKLLAGTVAVVFVVAAVVVLGIVG